MTERMRTWVESATDPDGDFPIENLPFGVFEREESEAPRIGVAIGDRVLDVREAIVHGMLPDVSGEVGRTLEATTLNAFAGLGRAGSGMVRTALQRLFAADEGMLRDSAEQDRILIPASEVELGLPFSIGDYTDFYASKHHASNVGRMFRPDGDPLLPNWKHLPVGYHGRASSIVESGRPIRRPNGQTVGPDGPPPKHGPVRLLDYELEVGFFLGQRSELGTPIPIEQALQHVFGLVLVNDWSARDVQKWEYQPLGPFNAKNFATTISPWVVTLEALQPFTEPGPPRDADDPANLPYLSSDSDVTIDLKLEVAIRSAEMRARDLPASRVSIGNYRDMYWTIAQMVAHHTSTGCDMRSGDLMASGTVSGSEEESRGCLLERTWRGQNPVPLADGTERKFLQDGDEVVIRGWCSKGDLRIGFGSCTGLVTPALG